MTTGAIQHFAPFFLYPVTLAMTYSLSSMAWKRSTGIFNLFVIVHLLSYIGLWAAGLISILPGHILLTRAGQFTDGKLPCPYVP